VVARAAVAEGAAALPSSLLDRCRSSPMGIPICKASGVLRIITTIPESKADPRLLLAVVAGVPAGVHPVVDLVARHPAVGLLRRLPAVLLLAVLRAVVVLAVVVLAVVGEVVPAVAVERQQPLAPAAEAVSSRRRIA